jgi:hypothetical protein
MVINCTFSGNYADHQGGGMYNINSSPTVTNCTFSENTTSVSSGGGMYNEESSPTVTNSSFLNNLSGIYGGGMFNYNSSSPSVVNCLFYKNGADGGITPGVEGVGHEIYNISNSSPTLTNCTFRAQGNTVISNFNSSPTLTNCILWGGPGGGLDMIINKGTSPGSSPVVTYSDIQGDYPGIGNINADPMFVDFNGDLHLQQGSPCIDAGTASGAPDTDLEGNPRPQGAGYDMGAYEFQLAKTTAMPAILLLLGD